MYSGTFVEISINLLWELLNQHEVCSCCEKISDWGSNQEKTSHSLVFFQDFHREFFYIYILFFDLVVKKMTITGQILNSLLLFLPLLYCF